VSLHAGTDGSPDAAVPTAPPPRVTQRPATKPKTSTNTTPVPATIDETPLPSPSDAVPTATPEIVVTTPIPEETTEPLAANRAGSSSPAGWAWFVAGMIVGGFMGLVSSGLIRKRRKKQAIFG
jgi:hypothetical protein